MFILTITETIADLINRGEPLAAATIILAFMMALLWFVDNFLFLDRMQKIRAKIVRRAHTHVPPSKPRQWTTEDMIRWHREDQKHRAKALGMPVEQYRALPPEQQQDLWHKLIARVIENNQGNRL